MRLPEEGGVASLVFLTTAISFAEHPSSAKVNLGLTGSDEALEVHYAKAVQSLVLSAAACHLRRENVASPVVGGVEKEVADDTGVHNVDGAARFGRRAFRGQYDTIVHTPGSGALWEVPCDCVARRKCAHRVGDR